MRFTCQGVPAKPGMAGILFDALGKAGINILHMFNAEHGDADGDIAISVREEAYEQAKEVIERIRPEIDAERINIEHNLALLSYDLGDTFCETALDSMTLALNVLSNRNVEVKHIAASRNRVFVVLPDDQAESASFILSRALKEDPIIHPI